MRYAILITLCSLLFACGTDNKSEPEKAKGVIPEHQLKAVEDAKKTEELMKKKLQETDKKIQEAVDGK